MVEVVCSTIINAPIETVWAEIRDFNGHDMWHPAVSTSRIEQMLPSDTVGSVRNFYLKTGENVREKLLKLSDKQHQFSYTIIDSDIPIADYVAHVELKPVTDGKRTFWKWHSRFKTAPAQENELAQIIADNVYTAGFEAIRSKTEQAENLHPATVRTEAIPVAAKPGTAIPGTAIIASRYGGPDVMELSEISAPAPGPDEVRIRQTVIGVNFIDIYCRTGFFKLMTPPATLGMEAVGTVIDIGSSVYHLAAGDRVGYACPPVGAYASVRTMNADLVFKLPTNISDEQAAASLLKGMTVSFLLNEVHKVKSGENILVFAPAGGVGRMLCQWASHLGARVIGATSSEEKAHIARTAGAKDVILPGPMSLEEQVMKLTAGHGADVIYDAVGHDSFQHSLASLAICGHLVSYGQASGPVGSYDIGALASKSATISRPNFGHYTDTPEKIQTLTERFFEMVRRGIVTIEIGQRFSLNQATEAHKALESRATIGSTILTVE